MDLYWQCDLKTKEKFMVCMFIERCRVRGLGVMGSIPCTSINLRNHLSLGGLRAQRTYPVGQTSLKPPHQATIAWSFIQGHDLNNAWMISTRTGVGWGSWLSENERCGNHQTCLFRKNPLQRSEISFWDPRQVFENNRKSQSQAWETHWWKTVSKSPVELAPLSYNADFKSMALRST